MLNQYFLALTVTAVTYLVLAVFIYSKDPKKLTNVTYALYSVAIAWWSGLEAFSITAHNKVSALFLWRLNHVGVFFIPIFFVHFVTSLLEDRERKRREWLIFLSYMIGIGLVGLNTTDLLIAGVAPRFSFRHFINPGLFYPWFFCGWLALAGYGLSLLFKTYLRSSGDRKAQLRLFCWSMLAAYLGGVPNFLPTFNIEIPVLMPFGTYAIPAYALVTVYAISQHRLMDINLAFSMASVFMGVGALLIGVPLLVGLSLISYYAVPPLIIAIIFLTMGAAVFFRAPRALANRIFALNCLTTIIWQGTWTVLFSITDPGLANLLVRIGYSGIIFIPFTFYHLVVTFTGLTRERWSVISLYAIGALFLVLLWTTKLFISGPAHFFWGYYPVAGILHPVFLFFLTVSALRIFVILVRQLQSGQFPPLRKNQFRYTLLSIVAYTFASIDFLVNYGISFYPFGYIFTLISALLMMYAVVRYRLMDINLVFTRTAVFMAVYVLALGGPLLVALSLQPRLEQFLGSRWWVWLLIAYAALATAAHYANLYLQRLAENRFLAEQRRYQATLRQASEGMTRIRQLPRLLKLTAGILSRAVGLTHVSIYLQDEETKRYVQQVAKGKDGPIGGPGLELDDPLIKYLLVHKNAIVLEEFHIQRQQAEDPGLREVEMSLRRLGAALVIPSFVHDQLLGFVVMGAKRSGQIYTDDDIKVLMTLANQAALAIENARFYEAEKDRQAEMFHTAQLASLGTMAGSMGHQINNRFYVEAVLAGTLKDALEKADLSNAPEPVKELIEKAHVAFGKIEKDAIRGGDIVKTLLDFSKPGKLERTAFPEILELSKDLAQYRVKFDEIEFESVMANPLPFLNANKNQLTEAFFNLMANAYDAIKSKEKAIQEKTLNLGMGQVYKGKLAISVTTNGKSGMTWLHVVVHDNGIGIKPEDLSRIFVPFFTTKATSQKGTGLGLYVIKRIVENHSGKIDVNSIYGEGTTFAIFLPAAEEKG